MARTTKKSKPSKASAVEKKIVRASKLPKRYRALYYGPSGAGKTRLAASAPDVLLIDVNDLGTDSVRRDYDPEVYEVEFWQQLNDIFWHLQSGDHPYGTVAIDGLTGMQDLGMKFVLGDEAARDASRDPDMPSRQVWGKLGELMKTQINNFRNLPMNVLFTALDRKKFVGEDEEEQDITIGPMLSPTVASAIERAVGQIGYLHTQEILGKRKEGQKRRPRITRTRLLIGPNDRYLTKDRYGLMVPHIDGPTVPSILDAIYNREE